MTFHAEKRMIALILALLCALALAPAAIAEEEAPAGPFVRLDVRDHGAVYAQLYPEYAPLTVENFLNLTDRQFYDGLTFHRIISGFMVQGGDPLGNGTGGSGQNIKGEFTANGVENPLVHSRGVLSMARSSAMDSASSQFFIMHQAAPHLDGQYAAFGQVLAGMSVVDRLCQMTPVQDNNGTVAKEDQPVIESVRRVEWEEVRQAMEAEAQNGLAGGLYADPLSPLSFPVPEGWNRASEAGITTRFLHEGEANTVLLLMSQNNYDCLPAASKAGLAAQGLTRQDLDTAAFRRDSLIGAIGADPETVTEEEHSGIQFLTAEITDDTGSATYYIGARDGQVYIFAFGGGREDPLFADVLGILDQLTFDP